MDHKRITVSEAQADALGLTLSKEVLEGVSYDPSAREYIIEDDERGLPNQVTAALVDAGLAAEAALNASIRETGDARARDYVDAYDKTATGDSTRALGYVLDAVLGQFKAAAQVGELTLTPEIEMVLDRRDQVKRANPF